MEINQRGASLIQVMMAAAIGSIIILALADMFSSQRLQIRFLSQKQEALELKNSMLQQLLAPRVRPVQ